MNMLGELERYCCYRAEGCDWQGYQDNFEQHVRSCQFRPKSALLLEIEQYQHAIQDFEKESIEHNRLIQSYEERILALEGEVECYQTKVDDLETMVAHLTAKLKMYDKLHNSVDLSRGDSDFNRLARLKGLSMSKTEEKR